MKYTKSVLGQLAKADQSHFKGIKTVNRSVAPRPVNINALAVAISNISGKPIKTARTAVLNDLPTDANMWEEPVYDEEAARREWSAMSSSSRRQRRVETPEQNREWRRRAATNVRDIDRASQEAEQARARARASGRERAARQDQFATDTEAGRSRERSRRELRDPERRGIPIAPVVSTGTPVNANATPVYRQS